MLFRRSKKAPRLGPRAGNVHLVRHGEVENPEHVVYALLDGFHLSERGRAQAAETADFLGDREIAAILCSPLARAVETAAAIGAPHAQEPIVDERLVEWRLAERWAGVVWEQLPKMFPGELEAYLEHPDNLSFASESLDEVAKRVTAAVEDHRGRLGPGDLVVVGHQDPTQAARLLMTGRGFDGFHQKKPNHGSVTTLVSSIGADAMSDPDWIEASYWEPSQGEVFPPI